MGIYCEGRRLHECKWGEAVQKLKFQSGLSGHVEGLKSGRSLFFPTRER
jgi:hypothetical protein